MLFTTLTYAKFLTAVFIASWLLVQRRNAVWLPWLGLTLLAPAVLPFRLSSWFDWSVWAIAGGYTWMLSREQFSGTAPLPKEPNDGTNPPVSVTSAALSAALNLAAAGWVLQHSETAAETLESAIREYPQLELLATVAPPVAYGLLLLPIAPVLLWLLTRRRIRLIFILLASYYFYANWDYRFLPLILGSSSIDFWLGQRIAGASTLAAKKRWLWATIAVNLGVLGIFKYLNFGIDSARLMLEALGVEAALPFVEVALPVGISFFTFESMSYVIDVYRGDLPAHRSYLEYLSFVAFFPHLVAGPIVRPRDLLPQLGGPPRFSPSEASEGLFLIAVGLMKKIAIGDYLGLNLVDRVFDAPSSYSALECYTGVVAYALQIYCDFSGYTDIAIGSALLLGIRFPVNFNAPYKASNVQDFWRRWHISLSTWLRDYVYIPLGGNRLGAARTYFNLILTMLLGGLWHGANWTFVVWGGLHGAALAVHRLVAPRVSPKGELVQAIGVILTFHFICLTWIFFRSPDFLSAHAMLSQLTSFTTHADNLHPEVLAVLALGAFSHLLPAATFSKLKTTFTTLPAPAQGLILFAAAFFLREMASAESVPFVYFQF